MVPKVLTHDIKNEIFYIKFILHNKYLPAGQIINPCFYRDVLKRLKTKTVS